MSHQKTIFVICLAFACLGLASSQNIMDCISKSLQSTTQNLQSIQSEIQSVLNNNIEAVNDQASLEGLNKDIGDLINQITDITTNPSSISMSSLPGQVQGITSSYMNLISKYGLNTQALGKIINGNTNLVSQLASLNTGFLNNLISNCIRGQ